MPHLTAPSSLASPFRTIRALLPGGAIAVGLAVVLSCGHAGAQSLPKPSVEAAPQAVPGFWDPRRRPDRPDLSRLTVIRFLTETDYPPFNLKRKPEEAAADLKRYL